MKDDARPAAALVFTASEAGLAAELFADIARMSQDTRGVSRPAWSAREAEVLDYLCARATEEGLENWADDLGNRMFCLPGDRGASPYTLIGSHADSVPAGGNFDGLAGIVAGLICLVHQHRTGRRFARPVRVIAIRGEESAWFGPCYTASKALMGCLTAEDLAARHKGDGRSLSEHMAEIGVPTAPLEAGQPLMDVADIAEYLELHIEQGPLLAALGKPAAIVTGIRGNLRLKEIVAHGEAGHSGAVPREYRRDPVMAVARLLTEMDDLWAQELEAGHDLVMTSGMISTDPAHHAMARIADEVRFSFELRSQSPQTLARLEAAFHARLEAITARSGVRFALPEPIRNAPAALDAALHNSLMAAMARSGQEPCAMASGGGHDAAIFSNAGVRAGMVFVRSRGGSHNPDEAMETDDMLAGAAIMLAHLQG